MGIVVQKFGGTSVESAEKIRRAARRAIAAKEAGHHVAVVVSARGQTTDELIELAREVHPSPPARELDMLMATGEQVSIALLAMAIHSLGHEAISLTGGQVGIRTDSIHGKARIQDIRTDRMRQAFEQGKIAIVAGFQGIDQEENITTLGRGGSDTTAVAIAAALGADTCEIYTDVTGVFTTDPRMVASARKIEQISYDEMLELASVGAGVMHSRSIEFAKKFGTIIHVRHAGKDEPGTLIRPEDPTMMHVVVRGAALSRNEARITLTGVPDVPGIVHRIFSRIAQEFIVVDMIVQDVASHGRTMVSFTVLEDELARTVQLARAVAQEIGAQNVHASADVAKVSVVGLGMRTHSGVAHRMFGALAAAGINIRMISTSDIKISVLVDREQAPLALQLVHAEFHLDEPLAELVESVPGPRRRDAIDPSAASERVRAVATTLPTITEEILVTDVDLADNQARITLREVPDEPGVAHRIFSRIAEAGVPVDLIVQNVGADARTHLSFTSLRGDSDKAIAAARSVMDELGGGTVDADRSMSKISVRGVGMRTHTGVAVRMFQTLAEQKVNVQLISTSELHITVVVDGASGTRAAETLRQAFGISPRS